MSLRLLDDSAEGSGATSSSPSWAQRWANGLDHGLIADAWTPRHWSAAAATLLLFLLGITLLPGLSSYFQLPLGPALAALSLLLAVCMPVALLVGGERPLPVRKLALVVFGMFSVEVFCGALALLCRGRGYIIFLVFLLVAMAFHGLQLRGAPRHPVSAVVSTLTLALLLPLAHDAEDLYGLLLVTLMGLGAQLLLGGYALRQDEARREAERRRDALQASILEQSMSEQERLSQVLHQVLGVQHDLANAAMSAVLNSEVLRYVVKDQSAPKEEVEQLADGIYEGLSRVQQIMTMAKSTRESPLPAHATVELVPVLRQAVEGSRARFPQVTFRLELPSVSLGLVRFRGGEAAVYRVVENLIVNACEGDGSHGAQTVTVRLRERSDEGRLEIAVLDDGPGFRSEQLLTPAPGYQTTKPRGSGLGLFSSERLVSASDGRLERRNLPQRGAMVAVLLPRADVAAGPSTAA